MASRSPTLAHTQAGKKRVPPFFGTVARTETLMILAANGPLTTRQICRLRGVNHATTLRTVERLVATGVVTKRGWGRRIVTLDRSHQRPLKLSMNAFCTGLPGAVSSGVKFPGIDGLIFPTRESVA